MTKNARNGPSGDSPRARKRSVEEGRTMVRVRRVDKRELLTAAVCPGCWNDPGIRRILIRAMAARGVEPAHPEDRANGSYLTGQKHAPRCPRGVKTPGRISLR